jgi:hypothetical protein
MIHLSRYILIALFACNSFTAFCQKEDQLLKAAYRHADSLIDNLAETIKVKADAEQHGDRFGIVRTTKLGDDRNNASTPDTILYQIGYYMQGIPCAYFVDYNVYYSIKTRKIIRITEEWIKQ